MSLSTGTCSKCGGGLNGSHPSYCRPCFNAYESQRRADNREQYNARMRDWRRNNPEKRSDIRYRYLLQSKYGMTVEEIEDLWLQQDCRCAICRRKIVLRKGNKSDSAVVDHDHTSGLVRGLLCGHCNKALGLVGDNIIVLEAAITYLTNVEEK